MENLTREKALELHRQMWTDMQRDLGDRPRGADRVYYKEDWCDLHFPTETITNNCFLCEYTKDEPDCMHCPIKWPNEVDETEFGMNYCMRSSYYYNAPISEILALPERKM